MKLPDDFYIILRGPERKDCVMVRGDSGDWLCGFECLDDAFAMMTAVDKEGDVKGRLDVGKMKQRDVYWKGIAGLRYKKALVDEPIFIKVEKEEDDDPYSYT